MKSLEKRYQKMKSLNPYWSNYISFCEAIRGQNFSDKIISFWFNKLVDKNDYSFKEKKEVLKHLRDLTRLN